MEKSNAARLQSILEASGGDPITDEYVLAYCEDMLQTYLSDGTCDGESVTPEALYELHLQDFVDPDTKIGAASFAKALISLSDSGTPAGDEGAASACTTPSRTFVESDDDAIDRECMVCMDRDPDVTMWPCQHVLCRKCAASEINRQKKSARDGSGSYCCFKCSQEVDDMTQDGESVLREVLAEAHAVCARPVPQAQVASFNVVVNQHASWQRLEQSVRLEPHGGGAGGLVRVVFGRSLGPLTDAELCEIAPAFAQWLSHKIGRAQWPHDQRGNRMPVALEVDMTPLRGQQQNFVGDLGVTSLCAELEHLFQHGTACVQVFKAWKNKIGDDGCRALAALLRLQGQDKGGMYALRELHLSHNHISAEGACLLTEACRGVYPVRGGAGTLPLWLRLHQNVIDVSCFRRDVDGRVRYCTRVGLPCRGECNAHSCVYGSAVHLPMIEDQRSLPQTYLNRQPPAQHYYTPAAVPEEGLAQLLGKTDKRRLLLDTNVFLEEVHDVADWWTRTELALAPDYVILIPTAVFEELDRLRSGTDDRGRQAREVLRHLDARFTQQQKQHMVPKFWDLQDREVDRYYQQRARASARFDERRENDLRILHFAEDCNSRRPKNVVLVTGDQPLRIEAANTGICTMSWPELQGIVAAAERVQTTVQQPILPVASQWDMPLGWADADGAQPPRQAGDLNWQQQELLARRPDVWEKAGRVECDEDLTGFSDVAGAAEEDEALIAQLVSQARLSPPLPAHETSAVVATPHACVSTFQPHGAATAAAAAVVASEATADDDDDGFQTVGPRRGGRGGQGGAGWTKEEVGRVLKVDRTSGQVIVELDMANCWRDYGDKDVGARDGTWKGLEDALRERIVAEICDHGQINGRVAIDVRLNGRCDRRGKLGPRGMAAVCAALSAVCHTDDARVIFGEHLPFVRKMFLHFNDLDDAAVSTLADFLEGQAVCAGGGVDKGMLRELHLSDNKISHRGAVRIVSAAKKSRQAMGVKPLWLRLENQKNADRIVRDRLSAAVSGAICWLKDAQGGACRQWQCACRPARAVCMPAKGYA